MNKNSIEYILKFRRFKLTFYDLYKICFLSFGLSALIFIGLEFIEKKEIKLIFYLISSILSFSLLSILWFNLYKRIMFTTYINNLDREINFKIILEVLKEFNITPTIVNNNCVCIQYKLSPLYGILQISQDIYLIPIDKSILVNVRNNDATSILNIKDNLSKKIIESILVKMSQKQLFNGFNNENS